MSTSVGTVHGHELWLMQLWNHLTAMVAVSEQNEKAVCVSCHDVMTYVKEVTVIQCSHFKYPKGLRIRSPNHRRTPIFACKNT